MSTARLLVLSYPAGLGDRDRERLERSSFRAYLRRAHDSASEGATWSEFVGQGCGSTREETLRVEHIEGGQTVSDDTAIEYVECERGRVGGEPAAE